MNYLFLPSDIVMMLLLRFGYMSCRMGLWNPLFEPNHSVVACNWIYIQTQQEPNMPRFHQTEFELKKATCHHSQRINFHDGKGPFSTQYFKINHARTQKLRSLLTNLCRCANRSWQISETRIPYQFAEATLLLVYKANPCVMRVHTVLTSCKLGKFPLLGYVDSNNPS